MAMQAGMGFSKIVFLAGAGYTTSVLMRNGKLSDILGELQNLVKNYEKSGEDGGEIDAGIAEQLQRIAREIRILSSSTRPITVLNGGSNGNMTNLLVPAAAVGALGYGYMWWKGISFSDLMYVTKSSMTTAVANLTKHLEHVSDALAATKRHLTQRIENVDGKLDDQIEISKLIRTEVNDVRGDLSQIGYDLDSLHRMVSGLDGKLLTLEEKQDVANAGVMYLCGIVNGKSLKMPDKVQEQLRIGGNPVGALKGLKDIVDNLDPRDTNRLITDGIALDISDKPNIPPRSLMRTASTKC